MVEATMRPLMPQPVMLVQISVTHTCGHVIHSSFEESGRDAAMVKLYEAMDDGEENACPSCIEEVA